MDIINLIIYQDNHPIKDQLIWVQTKRLIRVELKHVYNNSWDKRKEDIKDWWNYHMVILVLQKHFQ